MGHTWHLTGYEERSEERKIDNLNGELYANEESLAMAA